MPLAVFLALLAFKRPALVTWATEHYFQKPQHVDLNELRTTATQFRTAEVVHLQDFFRCRSCVDGNIRRFLVSCHILCL